MDIFTIAITSIAATTTMTIFSYLLSIITAKHYEEPRLIEFLMNPSSPESTEIPKSTLVSWLIHYAIGVVFMLVFACAWHFTVFKPGIICGAVFGLIAGLIGVVGWKSMFMLKPPPPKTPLGKYFLQLIVAHIIFGITAGLIYPLLKL